MTKKIMLGNEAFARGAWEAGVRVVSSYPGTPSTEVTETLATQEVIDREFGALYDIYDNYPKLVLSMDRLDHSRDGIRHMNIVDWLLAEG